MPRQRNGAFSSPVIGPMELSETSIVRYSAWSECERYADPHRQLGFDLDVRARVETITGGEVQECGEYIGQSRLRATDQTSGVVRSHGSRSAAVRTFCIGTALTTMETEVGFGKITRRRPKLAPSAVAAASLEAQPGSSRTENVSGTCLSV